MNTNNSTERQIVKGVPGDKSQHRIDRMMCTKFAIICKGCIWTDFNHYIGILIEVTMHAYFLYKVRVWLLGIVSD